MGQNIIYLVMTVIFALTSLFLIIRLHRIKKEIHKVEEFPIMSNEIKEASHEMANQIFKLRSGLNRISRAENPMEALIAAISRDDHVK